MPPVQHQNSSRRRTSSPDLLFVACCILFFFGFYTHIDMVLGNRAATVTAVSAIPGLILFAVLYWPYFVTPTFFAAMSFAFFAFLLSLTAPEFGEYFGARLVATAQLMYSLTLGLVAYWLITSTTAHNLVRLLSWLVPIFLMLMIIEILTPLKQLTIAYINKFHHIDLGGSIQILMQWVLERDVAISGLYRPKLFAEETSYVAMAFVFMIGSYAWLSRGLATFGLVLLYWIAGVIIIRSPITLMGFLPIVCAFLTLVVRDVRHRVHVVLLIVLGVLCTAMAVAATLVLVEDYIAMRWRGIADLSDFSTAVRTYGTYAAGYNVAMEFPITGVGIGSLGLARDIILSTFISLGVPFDVASEFWRFQINNAFGSTLIYFGFVYGAVIVGVAFYLLRRLAGSISLVFIAHFTILCLTFGAIYSPKFVVYTLIFSAVNKLVVRERAHATQLASSRPAFPSAGSLRLAHLGPKHSKFRA